MRPLSLLAGLGALLVASSGRARADEPPPLSELADSDPGPPPCVAGYFDSFVARCRTWEIRTDSAFSASRIMTQRLELAAAFPLLRDVFSLVLRVNAALDTDTTASFYNVGGPILAVGLRDASKNDDYWIEGGLRLIPGWNGPNDGDPRTLQLAYTASLTSGVADDARWLPFANTGYQIYAMIRGRAVMGREARTTFVLGSLYGGQVSLSPLQVQSWLGPQSGIIGNAFLELTFGSPQIAGVPIGLQLGVHGEVSLSSIWQGSDSLPFQVSGFIGWNPSTRVAVRFFYGAAGTPLDTGALINPYGLRVQYYFQ